jgi:hypothetical protein
MRLQRQLHRLVVIDHMLGERHLRQVAHAALPCPARAGSSAMGKQRQGSPAPWPAPSPPTRPACRSSPSERKAIRSGKFFQSRNGDAEGMKRRQFHHASALCRASFLQPGRDGHGTSPATQSHPPPESRGAVREAPSVLRTARTANKLRERDELPSPSFAGGGASTGGEGPFLQHRIPLRVTHIHRQHLHPMLARIAHDLRRRIETHGLRIQQRAGEHRRMVALEPRRRHRPDARSSPHGFPENHIRQSP